MAVCDKLFGIEEHRFSRQSPENNRWKIKQQILQQDELKPVQMDVKVSNSGDETSFYT